jgi:hypothetical protein
MDLNEVSYKEPEWQLAFLGENYSRLLKVKKRYDSDHVFDRCKCVSWRGEQESVFPLTLFISLATILY